jgi:hypothetical protein
VVTWSVRVLRRLQASSGPHREIVWCVTCLEHAIRRWSSAGTDLARAARSDNPKKVLAEVKQSTGTDIFAVPGEFVAIAGVALFRPRRCFFAGKRAVLVTEFCTMQVYLRFVECAGVSQASNGTAARVSEFLRICSRALAVIADECVAVIPGFLA